MECRLAGETKVLGENLPQRHFCPSQNPTWQDPGLKPGRRCGKPATIRLIQLVTNSSKITTDTLSYFSTRDFFSKWLLKSWVMSLITTEGQSASLSWNKAPTWGIRPDFYYCQTVAGLLMWGLSLTRGRVCRLQLLLALASANIFGSDFHGTRDHNLLSQIRDFHFRRLLRLAGLRWRNSTPYPHGILLSHIHHNVLWDQR
jgi:hypothetical protein